MMIGRVNANRGVIIQVAIVGSNKRLSSVRAVIDTGFTRDLTLPKSSIDQLGFAIRGVQEIILGDGSFQDFEMYDGAVIWNGQMRRVEVNAAETDSLIGMGLLEDCKLEIEARLGGEVKITPMSVVPVNLI
jgi:clan AA aspartic protease